MRAAFVGSADGKRRTYAKLSCSIIRGSDNTSALLRERANDNGFSSQGRIAFLFASAEECIKVDEGDDALLVRQVRVLYRVWVLGRKWVRSSERVLHRESILGRTRVLSRRWVCL